MTTRIARLSPPGLALVVVAVTAGCAGRAVILPSGPSTPVPQFAQLFDAATARCRPVDTLTAEIALSGRAGRTKLRGRVIAGMARPGSIRLEGVAPFGAPVFILVARGPETILLLPRDRHVLTGVPAADILQALVGLALTPDEMRAILSGCLTPEPEPIAGRRYGNGWIAIDVAGGATAFFRETPAGLTLAAGTVGALTIEYPTFAAGFPERVRIRSGGVAAASEAVASDLTLRLSQVETSVALGPEVFSVDVPEDALPLTLAELREQGPLGLR